MTGQTEQVKWAKVIDHTRCIGCHACTTACKSENLVPVSVTRTYVKHVDVGTFSSSTAAHQVTRCNQCEHAPCVTASPPPRCSSGTMALLISTSRSVLGARPAWLLVRTMPSLSTRTITPRRNVTSVRIGSTWASNLLALLFVRRRRF